jgi:S-ribosylhomocysteine lyase
MGCQTGFYIITLGPVDFAGLSELLARGLESVLSAAEVPLANDRQCGWASNHTLAGAQEVAAWLLRRRAGWADAADEATVAAPS